MSEKEVKQMLRMARFTFKDWLWEVNSSGLVVGWLAKYDDGGEVCGYEGPTVFDIDSKNVRNALFQKLYQLGWKVEQMKGYWRATNNNVTNKGNTLLELVAQLLPEGM